MQDRTAMKSKWTSARDKRLLTQQATGRTAAEIAKSLGVSRNAVIGRSRRLRGIVYRSDIESWARANARRSEEAKVRMKVCLLYTSPSPRDRQKSRMPSSA